MDNEHMQMACIRGISVIDSSTAERYYRESHQAICDLITEENEDLPVPACPGWTLRDLLAHVTGVMQDVVSGNTAGAPGPEWTAAHVDRFRDAQIESIKSAWRAALDQSGSLFRRMGDQLLPDIVTHEFDVRGALGNTDAREEARLVASVEVMASWGDAHYKSEDIRALELRTNRKTYALGFGAAKASVEAELFEASRVITGRRSPEQIRSLHWSTDPTPWIDHLSMLGSRDTALVE